MRLYCVALLIGLTAASGASASSIVTIAPPASGSASSFVHFGTPAPKPAVAAAAASSDLPALNYPTPLPPALATAPVRPVQASPSIVAMGEPAVENMQVSAIAEKKPASRRPDVAPMVIRGGISGEMFARESAPSAEPASSASPQPDAEQTAATSSDAADSEAGVTSEPEQSEPAAPPSSLGRKRGVQ